MEKLIGRNTERKLLENALAAKEAGLIAIYGRRRIGKTFLIRSVYKEYMAFEFTGIHEANFNDQLENFTISLRRAFKTRVPRVTPGSWLTAFDLLQQYLDARKEKKKSVLFFDEFPWINTPRSGFLQAFEHFWNTWASRQPGIIVVICGSAASWMIENIVRNKGGLHNRISQTIRLLPFTLSETERYLRGRGVNLDRYQLLQLYMAMGGIPQYLKAIQPGESAAQHIDRSFFTKDGMLKEEFRNLYQSLFANAQHHIAVVKALARKNAGLTRNEIIHACRLSSGGTTTRLLEELEESGFITPYIPFDKNTKDSIYKLSDEYSIFYLKFIEGARASGAGTWLRIASGSSYASWGGFAFESACQKHIEELKQALGIAGVHTETSAWRNTAQRNTKGAQVDLLLDRKDHCINICEMKFSASPYTIDKKYAGELRNKLNVFKAATKTKKTLFLTMVTTYGVKQNSYYTGLVQNEVTMDALFGER